MTKNDETMKWITRYINQAKYNLNSKNKFTITTGNTCNCLGSYEQHK